MPTINLIKDRIGEFFKFLVDGFRDALPVIRVVINKIRNFFTGLKEVIKDPGEFIDYLREKFLGMFDGIDIKFPGILGAAFIRLQQRFETLKTIFGKVRDIFQPIKRAFGKVIDVLDTAWEAIKNWFVELKDKLKAVMVPGDFDAVVDAVNVGLVGGILAVLTKFLRRGIKLDIGEGLLKNIGKSFEAAYWHHEGDADRYQSQRSHEDRYSNRNLDCFGSGAIYDRFCCIDKGSYCNGGRFRSASWCVCDHHKDIFRSKGCSKLCHHCHRNDSSFWRRY